MCSRPYFIDNPYYGLQNIGYNYLHDTIHAKIPVPCGICPSCIALKQSYFVQRCQMESLDNMLFMCTLTYSEDMIPFKIVNGFKLRYADFSDVQKMFKRIRKGNLFGMPFKYFCVSEYGGERHRPHFHLIFSFPRPAKVDYLDYLNFEKKFHDVVLSEWRRNVGTIRKPIYKPLCKYINTSRGRTFDFHYINPASTEAGEQDVSFYVTKYLLKSNDYVDRLKSALKLNSSTEEEFIDNWKLFKPRCAISKDWGNSKSPNVRKYIRKCINVSLSDRSLPYPIFINPISGQEFPMSPFYRKKFLTISDAHTFFYRGDDFTVLYDVSKETLRDNRFSEILSIQNNRENSYLPYLDL